MDYKKFLKKEEEEFPINPIEIFNRLGGMEKVNDLYSSQKEVLNDWFEKRQSKDLVVKLHTGGGKTLVGFLMALSIMRETGKGVVYLVPTQQLETQAFNKAISYGIPVIDFRENSQDPINDDFLKGKKILVATYKALFNAKSKFGILHGSTEIVKVGGIIIDDAHSSFSVIRDSFTIRIEKNKSEYQGLINLFEEDFKQRGEFETFRDIVLGNESGIMEVPYWVWKQKFRTARQILVNVEKEYPFAWPLIRDKLEECLILIGTYAISITPLFPVVKMIPTFSECERRVYMSATLDDDSQLIENFDADPISLSTPITAKTLAGIGEKQIIIPMITSLNDKEEAAKSVVKEFSRRGFGIVILIPSKTQSGVWEKVGAKFADSSEKVKELVNLLTERKSDGPYIFANRYDGIDLPGDSCRILILDGIPSQSSEYEKYQSKALTGSTSLSDLIGVRVEQGIGRASRGRGDYSVVILTGKTLSSWVSKHYDKMTTGTKAQIDIALNTTKEINNIESLYNTINQCIKRDKNWVEYHARELARLTAIPKPDETKLKAIGIMRNAFNLADVGYYNEAIAKLSSIFKMSIDNEYKGIAKEMQARFYFYWGKYEESEESQKAAFTLNSNLLKPKKIPPYQIIVSKNDQANAIVESLKQYKFRKGFLESFETTVLNLTSTSTSNQFEASLSELGKFIGVDSERPDNTYRQGPDVLWMFPDSKAYVIEIKSLKKKKNKFAKRDLGQLLTSFQWFKEQYAKWECIPVSIHLNEEADSSLPIDEIKVLTLDDLNKLIDDIKGFLYEICRDELSEKELTSTVEKSLEEHKLTYSGITRRYLKKFNK